MQIMDRIYLYCVLYSHGVMPLYRGTQNSTTCPACQIAGMKHDGYS